MKDIVKQLRNHSIEVTPEDAAVEIESLRSQLKEARNTINEYAGHIVDQRQEIAALATTSEGNAKLLADRYAAQAEGKHPAPCGRFCEANAFEIEIRRLQCSLKKARGEQP